MESAPAIYLDYNATTPVRPEVLEEMTRVSRVAFGNPGSRHAAGRAARQVLEASRETLAALLGAQPREVVFTSGGTESINLAIQGLCGRRGGDVVAPEGEHPATVAALRRVGSSATAGASFRRLLLPIDSHGQVVGDSLDSLPWPEVRLVTLLLAHNETGVIQNVGPLAERCRAEQVPLHIDAVQAVGKIPVDFVSLGATALSLGAHKFYGPRGIGALLIKAGVTLPPLLVGGHQEQGRRAGTECVSLAAGMALALELWHREQAEVTTRLTALRDRLQAGLVAACPPTVVIGAESRRLPNTLNLAFPQCDGEALLVALDLAGVCCSLGGTCASGAATVSPILGAMGLPAELHRSCLRLSVGRENTIAEIDDAIVRITRSVQRQRRPKS
ncbi:MAG: cysteine desulfurase family protein [Planctomycetaceae bacterium]